MRFGTMKGTKEKPKFDYKNVTYKDISESDYE